MKTVGIVEAKTKWIELLRDVEKQHEEIIIMKYNRNIARLIPFDENSDKGFSKTDILDGFKKIREEQTILKSDEIEALIKEGRRRYN
jgi:antitoxin (DNA-binding transcriptional repressor) of toxin-antitoxin stability system